jgi:tetratricopeptide (TPR) repeat protein
MASPSRSVLLQRLQMGVDLQREGKFREAEACYQFVLHFEPDLPDALNFMGTLALEAQDEALAADFFTKALKRKPKDPAIHHNLGSALMAMSQMEEALQHFRKALDQKPGQIDTLCLIGACYNRMSRAEEGLPFLEKAKRLNPEHPQVQIVTAEAHINLGRMIEAEEILKKAISRRVALPRAYQNLSSLKKYQSDSTELSAVLDELASTQWTDEERVPLHYAAAKMLNDSKQYDRAMEAFALAKQRQASLYDIDEYNSYVDSLIALFNQLFLQTHKNFGDSSQKPVFILGMPRSGTTLTEQIISSHPQVAGAGELGEMQAIARSLGENRRTPSSYHQSLLSMTQGQVQAAAQRYLKFITKYSRGALRITDKMPHNFEQIGLIALLFPNATIIHCTRDPIDNCLSCYMNAFNDTHAYSANLAKLGAYYAAYRRLMAHWHKVLPGRIFDSPYETLIAEQETQTRKLIAHCQLPWNDACLNYTENQRSVATISRWQVRQPMYTTSIKRWKNYERHIGPLVTALGPLANQ